MKKIKLWDWVVWNHFLKNNMYASQCLCLIDTSCFATYKMETYCLKCKKSTENIDPEVLSTSNGRVMILSKCVVGGSKKSRFIKHQEAKGLLSKLAIKTPLSKIPILDGILF